MPKLLAEHGLRAFLSQERLPPIRNSEAEIQNKGLWAHLPCLSFNMDDVSRASLGNIFPALLSLLLACKVTSLCRLQDLLILSLEINPEMERPMEESTCRRGVHCMSLKITLQGGHAQITRVLLLKNTMVLFIITQKRPSPSPDAVEEVCCVVSREVQVSRLRWLLISCRYLGREV